MEENKIKIYGMQDVLATIIVRQEFLIDTLVKELTVFEMVALSSTCNILRNVIYESDRVGQKISDEFTERIKKFFPDLHINCLAKGKISSWAAEYKLPIRFWSMNKLNHIQTWVSYLNYPTTGVLRSLDSVAVQIVTTLMRRYYLIRFNTSPCEYLGIISSDDVFHTHLKKIQETIKHFGEVTPFYGNLGNIFLLLMKTNAIEKKLVIKGNANIIKLLGHYMIVPNLNIQLGKSKDPRVSLRIGSDGKYDINWIKMVNERKAKCGMENYVDSDGKVDVVKVWIPERSDGPTKGLCCYIYGDGYVIPTSEFSNVKDFLVAFNSDIYNMCRDMGKVNYECALCGGNLWSSKEKDLGYNPICGGSWNLDELKDKKNVFGSYGIMSQPEFIDDVFGLTDEEDIPFFVLSERQKRLGNIISMCYGNDSVPINETKIINGKREREEEEEETPNPKHIKK